LEILASTLLSRPNLIQYTRSFFFQGPQGRRRTGRNQLRFLIDEDEDDADEDDTDKDQVYQANAGHSQIINEEMSRVGLEPGIEGEGQEATWDEHESLMHLCTLILRLCSDHLESIGFVDCEPWFLAPTEGGALNFPLPNCKEFTGVTVGLFGLLPHLQRKIKSSDDSIENGPWTSLQRIHLIGGDFGSFALQRVLLSSPTSYCLTNLHITAPTLYRPEHHSHLVKHIVGLLRNTPELKRISVGFLDWSPAPPKKKSNESISNTSSKRGEMNGTGEDSFERGQLRESRQRVNGYGPTEYDDRLSQCRRAYVRALPEALLQSRRKDCTAAIMKLPFAEGTPVGFAGWILSHHAVDKHKRNGKPFNNEDSRGSWIRRDLSNLPLGVAKDGAPNQTIWQTEPTLEWSFDGDKLLVLKGEDSPWMMN